MLAHWMSLGNRAARKTALVGAVLAVALGGSSSFAQKRGPGVVSIPGKGLEGAKQTFLEVQLSLAKNPSRPLTAVNTLGGRWAGINEGSGGTTALETRVGRNFRSRSFLFNGNGELTRVKVRTSKNDRVYAGDRLDQYLSRIQGKGATPVKSVSIYTPRVGSSVEWAAAAMAARASVENRTVLGKFNGTLIVANPGDSAATVKAGWVARDNSPARQRAAQLAWAKWDRQQAVELRKAERETARLATTPGREGEVLISALKAEAEKQGYAAYDRYALDTLKHPDEIKAFVKHYRSLDPGRAETNIRFAVNREWVAKGTADLWRAALQEGQ